MAQYSGNQLTIRINSATRPNQKRFITATGWNSAASMYQSQFSVIGRAHDRLQSQHKIPTYFAAAYSKAVHMWGRDYLQENSLPLPWQFAPLAV